VAAVLQTGRVPALKLPQAMRDRAKALPRLIKRRAFLPRKSRTGRPGALPAVPMITAPERPVTNRDAS